MPKFLRIFVEKMIDFNFCLKMTFLLTNKVD